MPRTLEQAAREYERHVFVGRERELAVFERWLESDTPEVLSVSGPGGIGKTALLGAFRRAAADAGRQVAVIDGRAVLPTREDLLALFGHATLEDAVAALNAARGVLLIDGFELLGDLTRVLREEVVPRLEAGVRLVVAGRRPLGAQWRGGEAWPLAVRTLTIDPLGHADARRYLERRGVTDPEIVEQIVGSCGGWPLALSLAADLVEQFGVRRLPAAPEWRLAVRTLVEHLLDEAADPALRGLIEAGAVVRRFDEEMLAALAGDDPPPGAFAALCRLSVVRPTDRGLALHDDVRRLVADDLRWRRPERHAELRLRALEHFRERAARASGAERERLLEERLFLWGHEVVSSLLYIGDESGEVWVEFARPEDRDELLALNRRWQLTVRPALGLSPPDAEWDAEAHWTWFAELVSHPDARVRVARARDGEAIGYDVVLPVCEATAALVEGHEVLARTVEAYSRTPGAAAIPATAADSEISFLAHLGLGGSHAEATRAALIRDLLSVLARGGVCLCSLDIDDYRRLAEALGYRPLEGSEVTYRGSAYQGYVLDLRHVGVEVWLQALLAGGPQPPAGPGELEAELRDVLAGWHDDRRVASSSLAAFAAPEQQGATAVRAVVGDALERARAVCPPAQALALRAVEVAYLEREVSHEHAAEALNVSRATFYRLLHRGVDRVADALRAHAGN